MKHRRLGYRKGDPVELVTMYECLQCMKVRLGFLNLPSLVTCRIFKMGLSWGPLSYYTPTGAAQAH
jgi:hypothetical protein